MGDHLEGSAPLFAYPIKETSDLKPNFRVLSYDDIVEADNMRTVKLGYKDHNMRSHLRRKGGASDLFDAGINTDEIRVIGH